MKFPRNARIFRGQLDAAPLASVFFLLVMFVLLSSLIYTPGLRMQIRLPVADGLPGVEGPHIAVAVDRGGRYYFENQMIQGSDLSSRLRLAAKSSPQPLTLVVWADKDTTREMLDHLALLARAAGIYDLLLATLPRVLEQPLDELPN